MQIGGDVLTALARAEVSGASLNLGPVGSLDRKLYTKVNEVIEAIGGKWNRKAGRHIFDGDAAAVLDPILLTGEYTKTKQEFGQFDTPSDVVRRVIELAEIHPGDKVLEPSAGIGNIALAALAAGGRVTCVEIDAKRYDALKGHRDLAVNHNDFLTMHSSEAWKFDVVVMNPPFAGQADIDHVLHAVKFLKPGGQLVSVMSAAVMYRTNAKTEAFRDFVHSQPVSLIEELPEGAFKESGTAVRACIVAFNT